MIFRILAQGAIVTGLCYGAYKSISYVSYIIQKKQQALNSSIELQNMQRREAGANQTEEEKKVHIKLILNKPEEKSSIETFKVEESKELEKFINAYKNKDDKKNGITELLVRLNMVLSNIENKKGKKSINTTNQRFQTLVLSNEFVNEMLISLGFAKTDSFYEFQGENTQTLKAAITYLEKLN